MLHIHSTAAPVPSRKPPNSPLLFYLIKSLQRSIIFVLMVKTGTIKHLCRRMYGVLFCLWLRGVAILLQDNFFAFEKITYKAYKSVYDSLLRGFPGGSYGKESAWNEGDPGSIPGWGRSPGEGHGNSLQYSCLDNSMTEESGKLQSMVLQRVRHDWATQHTQRLANSSPYYD